MTQIATMFPLLTDVSCLMQLFKVYIERYQHLEEGHAREYMDECVQAMLLLFCGSVPTWLLFVNIFMESAMVWLLLPVDMFVNNACLFLLLPENDAAYHFLCRGCHRVLLDHCFFPHLCRLSNKRRGHEKRQS